MSGKNSIGSSLKYILLLIINNSWIKSFVLLSLCALAVYFVMMNFSSIIVGLFDLRNLKHNWTMIIMVLSSFVLIPMFLNMLFFVKIIQIADNTKKYNQLVKQQNEKFDKLIALLSKNDHSVFK
ncbi:MAG: hypothetical protein ACRCTQ_00405 [Brevinemataceae bacterium]